MKYKHVKVEICTYCEEGYMVARGDDRCMKCRREREAMVQNAAEQRVRAWERERAASRERAAVAETCDVWRGRNLGSGERGE